jgi:hypothetical protein
MNAVVNNQTNLYEKLVIAAEDCLGSAAPQFIGRLIQLHLHKNPSDLGHSDIERLADWLQVATSLMAESPKAVDEFTKRVHELERTKN